MPGSKLSLRLRIFLFFALIAAGSVAAMIAGLVFGYQRSGDGGALAALSTGAAAAGFLILGLVTAIWYLFDIYVAKPIDALASRLRMRAHSDIDAEIEHDTARYLGDLAPAAKAVSQTLGQSRMALSEAIARETERIAAEKDRLEEILTDVPLGVLMVTCDHRIAYYDSLATSMLAPVGQTRLNRPVTELLQAETLAKTYSLLCSEHATGWCDLTVATADGTRQVSAHMHLTAPDDGGSSPGRPGYLLTLHDQNIHKPPDRRRPVYEFGLMRSAPTSTALSDLTFAVFDSETTGLEPNRGDEIVQLAAVRIVRGKRIHGEEIDMLVNPGRRIPPVSTKVHGITEEMVANAPDIATVGARLHRFAHGAVLVAHNAPFDMAFLKRHAPAMGVRWTNAVFDTILLSAILFGTTEKHDLDSLASRLAVTIDPALRHTALGDAETTAQVLIRMLPMLEARGLSTLELVVAECKKHRRLIADLN